MKVIAEAWRSYERHVVPASAPEIQRSETKKAFYAGASTLFGAILAMLEPGEEPTEADLRKMDAVAQELQEHLEEVRREAEVRQWQP
jgi:hypothetical protein